MRVRALLSVVVLVPVLACSAANLLGDGQPCFQAIECAPDLACVPNNPAQPDAGSRCSRDLQGVGGTPPATDAGMMMMMMDGGNAADARPDVAMMGMDSGPKDTGAPDMGMMGMPDTGSD